jgi:phosphate transport system permease protein
LVRTVLVAAAGLSVVVSVSIVLALTFRTINFVSNVELSSLWSGIWRPRQGEFDLISLFYGSLVVTSIAMIVAAPLGLGAAAYLSEYAKPGTRRKLKPILETLAGVPSVVIGFFALTVINPGRRTPSR